MCHPFEPTLPTSPPDAGDPSWLARSNLPLYVGEVETVVLDGDRRPQALILDDGIAFAIPADMGGAAWSRLGRGDMVCIRHGDCWIGDMLAIVSVDTMDGRTSFAGSGGVRPHAAEDAHGTV